MAARALVGEEWMPISTRVAARRTLGLRVAAVDTDESVLALFGALLADEECVATLCGMASLTELADTRPDVIILGLGAGAPLAPWPMLDLIRAHRSLRLVPVIVCTLDVARDMRAGRLSTHEGVHALQMPFEAELLTASISRVRELARRRLDVLPGGVLARAGRLSDICPHGFVTEWVETCSLCVGTARPSYPVARA
jgi:hypothetical protein